MKKLGAWALGVFVLAACSDLTGADSGAAGNAGGGTENAGTPAGVVTKGDGEALEEVNVIYRDGDPYRLTLRVGEEWEDAAWYIGDSEKPAGTGRALEIDARALSPAEYPVMFTGLLRGLLYSETVKVAVRSALTEEVRWTDTGKNSSQTEFVLAAWERDGTGIEKWRLLAAETSRVYFAVRKRPLQTITVTGEHGDKVTKAKIGEAADGLKASTEMDVFTVDTGDVETLFGGGERRFSLMVEEEGKEFRMIQVELEARPYLTGAAVFAVKDGGALERITAENVTAYANDLYGEHLAGGFPEWGIKIEDVTGLAGAFKWLDSYAASGESADNLAEYLVRVEKDEALDRTALTGYRGDTKNHQRVQAVKNIRIRLRGYGAERRISHNSSQTKANDDHYKKGDSGLNILNKSLISIGEFEANDSAVKDYNITLQLEENITIDAASMIPVTSGNEPWHFNVVYAANSCVFVMKPGSKLVRANGLQPVFIGVTTGRFEMDGGEISGCRKKDSAVYIAQSNSGGKRSDNKFVYRGGAFIDNTCSMIYVSGGGYNKLMYYDDPYFAPENN
jgi:hypothetical protein